MRQGRGVWFNSTNGWTEYGSFLHDMEDGEMVVKSPIPQSILKVSPRSGGDNLAYEIRIGIWEKGKFVRWKNNLSNPTATRAFVSLFAPPVAKVDDPSTRRTHPLMTHPLMTHLIITHPVIPPPFPCQWL